MNRINKVFEDKKNEKIMSLFITAGYPDVTETVDLVLGFERNGADIIELGFPHNTPIADGGQIQESSYRDLKNGIKLVEIALIGTEEIITLS